VLSRPFLDNNTFGAPDTTVAAGTPPRAANPVSAQ
jgi:hypothetical protein